jgi:hypothetical protein
VLLGRDPEIPLQIVSRILPEIVYRTLLQTMSFVPEIAGAGHWPAPGSDVNVDYFIRMVLMLVVRS